MGLAGGTAMSAEIAIEHLKKVREIAEITGLAPTTIYKFVHEGRIPYLRLGEAIRFRPSDVQAWLEAQARPGRLQRVPSVSVEV
jgi:excisionase family DNA binding protein